MVSDMRHNFNQNPMQYELSRPKYDQRIAGIVGMYLEPSNKPSILEIGCGTGQATVDFVKLPHANYMAIDIGADLINLARQKFLGINLDFIVTEFENLDEARQFDCIFSATAYHWIKQPDGNQKVRRLLAKNGIFAVFRNIHTNQDQGFFSQVQAVYQQFPQLQTYSPPALQLIDRSSFSILHRSEFLWTETYTVAQYLSLLSTYSDHSALPAAVRAALFADIADLAKREFGSSIAKHYTTVLEIAN